MDVLIEIARNLRKNRKINLRGNGVFKYPSHNEFANSGTTMTSGVLDSELEHYQHNEELRTEVD